MLPSSIRVLVNELFDETKNGRLTWLYNYELDMVECNYKGMNITLDYKFDYTLEYGVYRLNIEQGSKCYYFTQSMYETDYDWLKQLYSEAQGSEFKF